MFFKLALNNVRKSIKDYTIYFLTLTFGICIFYVFNSIESQQAMLKLNESQRDIIQILGEVIGYVSVFISVILGFLILFANKFLIKRRKKELGLYMTLGMEKGKISRVLILETVIIGIVSLVVGLSVGVFVSQGLSVVTAHLFAVDMKTFAFTFSKSAFVKSILYFGVIYLVVMIFNTITISKYKLIDLLTAGKKNESLKVKNIWVSVILFIISVISLAVAYKCIIKNGMMAIDNYFWTAIIMGIIGTLLFFMSLSGFLLKVVQSNKKLYYKNLNMFVLRQLNSKINTTYISMSIICVMLLVAIGTLSTGIAVNGALTKGLEKVTPFDVTIDNFSYEEGQTQESIQVESLSKFLKDSNIGFDRYVKEYTEFRQFQTELKLGDILLDNIDGVSIGMQDVMKSYPIPVVALSEYNQVLKMQGKEPLELEKTQFAINCNASASKDYVEDFIKKDGKIQLGGQELTVYKKEVIPFSMVTTTSAMDIGTVIVNDELISNSRMMYRTININFNSSDDQSAFLKEINKFNSSNDYSAWLRFVTKDRVYEQSVGLSAVVTFLALYIGVVFLITCAAVLALQQLSEASDNAERYTLLRKLGAENKMINKALFMQILIYFMMPLALATVHSVVGIKVASNIVKMFGKIDILGNTLLTAGIIVFVYGGYFLATYFSSKNIIRPRKN